MVGNLHDVNLMFYPHPGKIISTTQHDLNDRRVFDKLSQDSSNLIFVKVLISQAVNYKSVLE